MFSWFSGRRRQQKNVILWWGSFHSKGNATIGDAHAVENLSRGLLAAGFEHCIVSKVNYPFAGVPIVQRPRHLQAPIETLIFVCGPLLPHPLLDSLLDTHRTARKFAVGVSVVSNEMEIARKFDRILARDGTADATFDLAPAGFAGTPMPPATGPDAPLALCFVGMQTYHGQGRVSHDKIAQELLIRGADQTGLPISHIDTVLYGANGNAAGILKSFNRAQIVATTRLHGSLYSLMHGRPVVAVDQIPGKAKVSEVLAKIKWPLALGIESADQQAVDNALATARSPGIRTQVERARNEAIAYSQAAVRDAVRMIVG